MPADHQRHQTLDRILASVRDAADANLRSYGEAVAEAATDELRREATAQVAQLRDTIQRLELTRIDLESQLAESRRFLEDARRDAEDQIAAVELKHQPTLAALAQAAAERHRAETALEDLRRHQTRVQAGRVPADTLRALDEARSLADALDRLTDLAAKAAERVALLLVTGETLSLWRTAGFDDMFAASIPRTVISSQLLTVARREARSIVQPHVDGRSTLLPRFAIGDRPRAAIACPLLIGRDVVAMIYADAPPVDAAHARGDAEQAPDWCDAIETLARYTGRVLESLTIQLALAARTPLVQPSQGAPSGSSLSSGGVR